MLEDEPDPAVLCRHAGDILVREVHAARVGPLEPRDDPQEGRLAAATGAEQRDERPGLDLERDVVECREVAEALGDVPDRDAHVVRSSLGRMTIMETSTSTAMIASTSEIA